jgi:hypothetical protein
MCNIICQLEKNIHFDKQTSNLNKRFNMLSLKVVIFEQPDLDMLSIYISFNCILISRHYKNNDVVYFICFYVNLRHITETSRQRSS